MIELSYLAVFNIIVVIGIVFFFAIFWYVKYKGAKALLKEYTDITSHFENFQSGIGKFREDPQPRNFVHAVGSRKSQESFRR